MTTGWYVAPDRAAGLARLAQVDPAAYARTRNHLDGAVTGLSPYLTHGLISLREVLAAVLSRGRLPIGHKLVFELGWREYFRHVWSHQGEAIFSSLHPGPCDEQGYDTALPDDLCRAATGVPAIDSAVRSLYATGYLHNHARMWLASYVVHLRKVHWRSGADWMVAYLLDGDLASNHLSWQWVAGTGSHKPYLFNAENVARFAPAPWHSPGSVIDQSYERLDQIARSTLRLAPAPGKAASGTMDTFPCDPLLHRPPADLGLQAPDAAAAQALAGRRVWLVHPWALRLPPEGLAEGTAIIGIYPKEHHQRWPWSAARWRWVDAAMSALTPHRWLIDAATLSQVLADSDRVECAEEAHVQPWLPALVKPRLEPTLFPAVSRPCTSFSQWWTRSTRGLQEASALLR